MKYVVGWAIFSYNFRSKNSERREKCLVIVCGQFNVCDVAYDDGDWERDDKWHNDNDKIDRVEPPFTAEENWGCHWVDSGNNLQHKVWRQNLKKNK